MGRRRHPLSFLAGPSRPPVTINDADRNNDSNTSLSSPGALSTHPRESHATTSNPSSYGALGKIAAYMFDTERRKCALDVQEAYDENSRYFVPVEVASSVERLVRRCEASVAAIDSVLTARGRSPAKDDGGGGGGGGGGGDDDDDDDDDSPGEDRYQQRRQGPRTGAGLWLLLSATNVESECLLALLHLSAALDMPLACAGLVVAGVALESGTDDDDEDEVYFQDGSHRRHLSGTEQPSASQLYQWLIQEASINGSLSALGLLLENAPALANPQRCGGDDVNDTDNDSGLLTARESHPRHPTDTAAPFRPCRMERVEVLNFLERVSATMQRLDDLGVENAWGVHGHSASETTPASGWGDSSLSTALAEADLSLSPSFSSSSLASLSSSFGGAASRLQGMALLEEWDDCSRYIESSEDADNEDAVERECAESLLRSSLARLRRRHSPIMSAGPVNAAYGSRETLRRLLSPPCGSSPLHWASYKGHKECAVLLLLHGADPTAVATPTGWTPLHDAAYSNSTDVLQILLEAGANVNATATSGATPLCFACQENAVDATQLLLQSGATVLPLPSGTYLAARALVGSRSVGGPPVNPSVLPPPFGGMMSSPLPTLAGYTPLHYCARFNSAGAARVLLNHCRDNLSDPGDGGDSVLLHKLLDAPDSYGRRPLDIACLRASVDVLWELLHHGATVGGGARRPASIPPTRRPPNFLASEPRTASELRSLIPLEPVVAPKPWNCLLQESIDGCHDLLRRVEGGWSTDSHELFTPDDRAAADFVRSTVRPYMERERGVYREMWPLVLSYCGRGWFVPS